jgi:hypothetical protein
LGSIERGKTVLIFRRGFAVLDIEPFHPPPLDRGGHGKLKVLCFRTHRNNGSAQFRFFDQGNVGAESKD